MQEKNDGRHTDLEFGQQVFIVIDITIRLFFIFISETHHQYMDYKQEDPCLSCGFQYMKRICFQISKNYIKKYF